MKMTKDLPCTSFYARCCILLVECFLPPQKVQFHERRYARVTFDFSLSQLFQSGQKGFISKNLVREVLVFQENPPVVVPLEVKQSNQH